ncbi:MAG: carbohydrate ABC transporter permease [Anaerolineales bacterium]|jgi:multiple sugar transport system permease protein|nr:carbohydrate ABC transporter permease [Anaerolineales bacterium]
MLKIERKMRRVLYHIVAVLTSLVFALPLIWLVSGSLRQAGLPPTAGAVWISWPPAWENYTRLFDLLPFGRYLLNSLLVAVGGALLTLLSASLGGFGMSQLPRRARRVLLAFSVALLIAPVTVLWLPRFLIFSRLGWIDSYAALLAPALMGTSPLFILLFYWTYRRIPEEQFEAARMDGAGALHLWRLVALPQAKPALLAVGVLAFLTYWNDFLQPLLYLRSQKLFTLAIGLQQLQQMDRTNWPLMLAGGVLMTLPVMLVFWLSQRALLREVAP